MKLDCYSYVLYGKRIGKCNTPLFISIYRSTLTHTTPSEETCFEIWMFALISSLDLTYPYARDKIINHEILNAFHKGFEVCGKFLDISKAFTMNNFWAK